MTQALLNIAIVLLFSAFFSGIEMAFRASDKLRAELDRHHTGLTSRILSLFYGKPNDFISAMLVGNFISLVVYSLLMAGVVSQMLSGVSLPVCRNDAVQLTLQVAVTAFIVIITGELLPKTLFKINPHRMLRIFAIPAFLLYAVLCPIAQCINAVARGMLRLVGIRVNRQASEQAFTKIDLDNLIQSSLESTEDEHELNEEIKIFQNALYFSEIKVRDCMVPRTEIEAIESTSSIETLKNRFIESGNSKIIVYKEDIDHIVGFIHSSEMFRNPADWTTRIIETPVVPETMSAQNLLKKFMQQKKSLAIVVDEFGGTSGIVTMEDLVEEIFGDIEDEHDNTHYVAQKVGEHEYVLSGRLEVEKANELLGLDLPESEDYVTVSGLILHRYQSFPKLNEIVKFDHFEFKIIKNTTTKIELVRLKTTE